MAASRLHRTTSPFICQFCRQQGFNRARRTFTSTIAAPADPFSKSGGDGSSAPSGLDGLSRLLQQSSTSQPPRNSGRNKIQDPSANPFSSILDGDPDSFSFLGEGSFQEEQKPAHRLHVYAHKHNTHITLVQPPKSAAETASSRIAGAKVTSSEKKKMVDVLLSFSTGNIGFRKAGRGSYDAAFQLAAFTLKQMEEKGMWKDVFKLEVILRGFGAGRDAVSKALLGSEGKHARHRISAVVDATRLKQGGPRSKKPRRLG